MVKDIFDINDPTLDVYTRLTEVQLRNKLDPEKGIFIAESPKVIKIALASGYKPLSFLMERKHIEGQAKPFLEQYPDIPAYTANHETLSKLVGYSLTRGILCAMRRKPLPNFCEVIGNAKRIVVLDSIADSTNVGAIVRSAAALNMDAVLITPTCCDPLCRRAIRVSMGTIFQIPWTRIGSKMEDWPKPGMDWLKEMGFKTVAMALKKDSVNVNNPKLMAENKLAIIMGTEGDGLANTTISDADYTVCIPMAHGVDSLNVAAASAVAFWQLGNK